MKKMVKKQGRKAGGPWECYDVGKFYGWEAERVVVVMDGANIMELITRARTCLSIILVKSDYGDYPNIKKYFQEAADRGLVEVV